MGRVDVRPLERLGQLAQEAELRASFGHDHVQLAVVELRVGEHEHAAAVGLRVADRDRVAGELVALAVDSDGEARRLPGGKRAQRRVEVDGVALDELGLVGDPVGVRVEPEAGDPDERRAVHARPRRAAARVPPRPLARRPPGRSGRRARARSRCPARRGGSPAARARPLSAPGERAHEPVAAQRGHGLPGLGGARRLLGGVLDAARVDRAVRGRRARSSSRCTPGARSSARPPAEAGFTSSAKRRLASLGGRGARLAARSAPPLRARRRAGAPLLELLDVGARSSSSSPTRRSAWGSSGSSGSSTSSTSCCTVCQRSSVTRSEATSSWPGRCSQCSSKMPEPVGVEPLAVREEEVEAAEKGERSTWCASCARREPTGRRGRSRASGS